MKILSVNCGSSSLRWGLFDLSPSDASKDREIATGRIEEVRDAAEAWERASPDLAGLSGDRRPEAIGHRVVHGGERFADAVRIDDDVLRTIEGNEMRRRVSE